MILSCNNINKEFVTGPVLKNCSFHVEENEKAAIVGINGAGKSTLLKIIMGIMPSDSGTVTVSNKASIGYLSQQHTMNSNNTIYDEVYNTNQSLLAMDKRITELENLMKTSTGDELNSYIDSYAKLCDEFKHLNGYAYRSEVVGVLKGLGFVEEDFNKQIDTLSGGQKTRVSLSKLLLSKPEIIMLDEPTNHLDIASVSWLETFLSNYNGCVIIVSHDRYFLDKIVTKVIEIDNCNVSTYNGNYSAYSSIRAMKRAAMLKAYLNQQKDIKHQEDVITKLKSFNREKSIKRAESREKMLDRVTILDKPSEVKSDMNIKLEPRIVSGNDVLNVSNLSKSFDENILFTNLNFEIKRGEHVALIGDNGTGKTTILKILNNMLLADSGSFTLGSNVSIGYYDQEHHVLHENKTIFEEISDSYPTLTNTQIRNVLASFLFTNEEVFKSIKSLSGGELGRVSLAKLMLSESNFLILDEPTNHLDITSKEILENAINNYTGTVLCVSHDRYFINQTATRIIDLHNKILVNSPGNYDDYMNKYDELNLIAKKAYMLDNSGNEDINISSLETNITEQSNSKEDWKAKKEKDALERKKQNLINKLEKEIETTEQKIEELNNSLCDINIGQDIVKLTGLQKELDSYNNKINDLYEKWEEAQS